MICSKCKQVRPDWWPDFILGSCSTGGTHAWVTNAHQLCSTYTTLGLFVPLHPRGNPSLLLDGEVELASQDNVKVYNGLKETDYQNGLLKITSQRLLYIGDAVDRAIAMNLEDIESVEKHSSFLDFSKIRITGINRIPVQFAFRKGGIDAMLQRLQEVLRDRKLQSAHRTSENGGRANLVDKKAPTTTINCSQLTTSASSETVDECPTKVTCDGACDASKQVIELQRKVEEQDGQLMEKDAEIFKLRDALKTLTDMWSDCEAVFSRSPMSLAGRSPVASLGNKSPIGLRSPTRCLEVPESPARW